MLPSMRCKLLTKINIPFLQGYNEALSIYNDLKENQPLSSRVAGEEFEASNGWFERFKTRANLHNVALKGEESASADTFASEKFHIKLKAIIDVDGYSSKQVDETGRFWKRLPSRTYLSKTEISCPGKDDLAAAVEFDGMGEKGINDPLSSNEEELDNETLLAIAADNALEDNAETSNFIPERKKLTAEHISRAMQLIDQAMDIFADNDPDENRSSIVRTTVAGALNCYKDIFMQEKKNDKNQQTLDQYLKKTKQPTPANEIVEL